MANHKSALKRARQSEAQYLRNKMNRTRVKNALKTTRALIEKDPQKAVISLKDAMSTLAKAATKGALPKKTASRRISRLAKAVYLANKEK